MACDQLANDDSRIVALSDAGFAAGDVTELLVQWSNGNEAALERLMPLVYEECRRIAARQMRGEREEHTLTPTALVNELYLRLVDQRRTTWSNRAQFFGIAAQLMRRVLVDHARARLAEKRDGGRLMVSLEAADDVTTPSPIADVLAIDDALLRLGQIDPRSATHRGAPIFRRSDSGGDGARAGALAPHGEARVATGESVALS